MKHLNELASLLFSCNKLVLLNALSLSHVNFNVISYAEAYFEHASFYFKFEKCFYPTHQHKF